MGRKKEMFVRKYYAVNENNELSCNICNQILIDKSHNLGRHLRLKHSKTYELYQLEVFKKTSKQSSKAVTVKYEVHKDDVKKAFVDLIVNGGCSYSLVDNRGFRQLVQPLLNELNITMNPQNIKEEISLACAKMKTDITEQLRNKLFSLKFDEVTRLNRSVLGINVQFIRDTEIVVYTLAMVELTEKHTAKYIKNIVLEVLEKYNLSIDQVYSITTDNGRNMLNATALLNSEIDNTDELDELDEDSKTNQDISKITNISFSGKQTFLVNKVHCAAHTIQLCFTDLLKDCTVNKYINKLRNVARVLRTPTHRSLINLNSHKQPIINIVTRWNSTYDMVVRLLELKDYCERYKDIYSLLKLSEEEWTFAETFIDVCEPIKTASLKLQQNQLPMGDFYKIWLEIKVKVKKNSKALAKSLQKIIETRDTQLMENQTMLTCLYLDPRFNFYLNNDKKEKAVSHLKKLYDYSITVENQHIKNEQPNSESVSNFSQDLFQSQQDLASTSLANGVINDIEFLMWQHLNNKMSKNTTYATNININERSLAFKEIEDFCPERQDFGINLLHYWQIKTNEFPVLSKLAKIVHATPATQVSVERCFSALKLILSDQRNHLLTENLEEIMLLRYNLNFEYQNEL